jgi:hypothetical protein
LKGKLALVHADRKIAPMVMGRPGRKIAAVMLSWESADIIERVVASTREWADRVFVLDTGSTDGSDQILLRIAARDPAVDVSVMETDAETFNHGRCVNVLLDRLDDSGFEPYWLAKIDCDEMFEPGFVEHSLPIIRNLPTAYTEVSFLRPTLFYSENMLVKGVYHDDFRERAFQRWRSGLRYPATRHHLHRSLTHPSVTFASRALLLHYSLRSRARSQLQYERLKVIDREWPHLLMQPGDDAVELEEIVPLEARARDRMPSRADVLAALARGRTPASLKRSLLRWEKLRRRGRSPKR